MGTTGGTTIGEQITQKVDETTAKGGVGTTTQYSVRQRTVPQTLLSDFDVYGVA